ncbi:hypothetical protein [Streptomyces sp. NPDC005374]|uniref:hypothetical protein n=1 Tax=Streptomyces sp. NPDC005374 TaxID=3364713 RepID=UPI00369EECFB
MARQYRLSDDGRARLAANARKGLAAIDAPARHIAKLEEQADKLTLEERDAMLGIVLRSAPNRDAIASPETLAEISRLLGGGSA